MSSDDANRTARGQPPAPFATDDTLAAPVTPSQPSAKVVITSGSAGGGLVKAEPAEVEASASTSLPVLDRLRYRIIGEVGRGGLGRVFRARDIHLDREVAVKELIDPAEAAQRRFVREALITARLQHPAIVPIYDAGQSADQGPFYAMKLVAGRSLADALTAAKTLDARLALLPSVIAVCEAMAYAHNQNIIHRDLKPQNVLVGDFGETVLIDWGLAKDLGTADTESVGPYRASVVSMETLDGAVMGTPAFMAPEQATAGDEVDKRADVYALGSILYYVGCGSPPHTGKTVDDILVKVIAGDVMPLQQREPRIPADLAAIVTKAMARDPAQRYPSAGELADDLRKFQLGKLVGAKTYTRVERLRRWVARNKRSVGVSAVALLVLLAYGGWSLRQIMAERHRAEEEAARAVASERMANEERDKAVAQALLVRARQYAATGHVGEELAVLRALARPDAGKLSRELAITEGGLIWKGHQRLAMALGRDVGLALRSSDGSRFVVTEPGAIVVWDAATGKELARVPFDAGPTAARFGKIAALSPGGRYAVVATCEKPNAQCGIMIADDDRFVLKPDTRLELRELVANAKPLATWSGKDELRRSSLAFAYDDSAIAIRRGDQIQVLTPAPRELAAESCTGSLAVSPNATHVAVACKDHVRLIDAKGPASNILAAAPAKQKQPVQLHFPSSDRLIALSDSVKLWDLTRNELRGEGKLPDAPDDTSVRDEGEDIAWTIHRPNAAKTKSTAVPQIRIGSSTSIVPRTSVLGPPPRIGPSGAILTLEGPDWQALQFEADQVRYALVGHLLPQEPPERCLSRIGGERHATTALDNGARLLVDEQEIAVGLAIAPPEGYRHTTTDELPVRQLRPLIAAEADVCLVWGGAVGAHSVDGGAIGAGARALDDGRGGLLVVDGRATRVGANGARTKLPVNDLPVESPAGTHVVSIDLVTELIAITDVASGATKRTWKAPANVEGMQWAATDVAEIRTTSGVYLLPVDPAIAPRVREPDLVTDAHTQFATRVVGTNVSVVHARDAKEVRLVTAGTGVVARPLPDNSGSIVLEYDGKREVESPGNVRIALAPTKQVRLGELETTGGYLISRSDSTVSVWALATGRSFAVPVGVRDLTIVRTASVGDEAWIVTGDRTPKLERIRLDGKGARPEVRLSTVGLPFHQVRDGLQVSADGKRLTVNYAVTENLFAVATWNADTGALLWVGPPASTIVGDWVLAGGRAYIPSFDVDAILRDTGARTNLRLCKKDLRAVPVSPPPAPDTYWAPDEACADTTRRR